MAIRTIWAPDHPDCFKATCLTDPRLNFTHPDLSQFQKLARLGIKYMGWNWLFEGGGVELDPVEDLGIPEDLKLHKSVT